MPPLLDPARARRPEGLGVRAVLDPRRHAGLRGVAAVSATSIEWTDAVWNCVRGCSRVSEGCTRCYAERMAARNLPEMRSPTTGKAFAHMSERGPRWTGKVELIPSKLEEPLRWRKPRRVFVNSMSDLFHEALPEDTIDRVFAVMADAERHTFQVLTKRPARMLAYLAQEERRRNWIAGWLKGNHKRQAASLATHLNTWPLPNVWLGVSCEDQATADERIPLMLQTPAAVRFVSYEPALGPVDFGAWLPNEITKEGRRGEYSRRSDDRVPPSLTFLDQIIVGGESGPGARPFDPEWMRSTVRQCHAAGVAAFCKQWGSAALDIPARVIGHSAHVPAGSPDGFYRRLNDSKGGDPSEWGAGDWPRELPA